MKVLYLSIISHFFQELGAVIPRQSSHQRSCGTVCFSSGSCRQAPGMSFSVRTTCASATAIYTINIVMIHVARCIAIAFYRTPYLIVHVRRGSKTVKRKWGLCGAGSPLKNRLWTPEKNRSVEDKSLFNITVALLE